MLYLAKKPSLAIRHCMITGAKIIPRFTDAQTIFGSFTGEQIGCALYGIMGVSRCSKKKKQQRK